jgi:cyanophycin synthetase
LRGRAADEIINLLLEGINEAKKDGLPVTVIESEQDAIMYAYDNATQGSLVTLLADKVDTSLELIKRLKEGEDRI